MNLEDLAKKTISEVSSEIEEQERRKEVLKNQKSREERAESEVLQPPKLDTKEQESFLEKEIQKNKQENKAESEIEQQVLHSNLESKEKNESPSEVLDSPAIMQMQNLGEDIFLKNLRERILVLFEGLNHIKREDLEQRLNLTIHFLEFLLANIEDKLKK